MQSIFQYTKARQNGGTWTIKMTKRQIFQETHDKKAYLSEIYIKMGNLLQG